MKLIFLVDVSFENFKLMSIESNKYKSVFISTERCNEYDEYDIISNHINDFINSKNQIFLIKYSGRESISKDIGDEYKEMIIPISSNKNSKHYIDNQVNSFINLLNFLVKEKN